MPLLWSAVYLGAIGLLSYVIGESLPRCWFLPDRFPYRVWKWEKNGTVYEKLGVQKWKDRAPDMSKLVKKQVPKRFGWTCPSAEQVRILIRETCRAEIVHAALCLCSPVVCLFWRDAGWGWGLLITFVYILGNLPFIVIQRYNRPALVALAARLTVREERKRSHADLGSIG